MANFELIAQEEDRLDDEEDEEEKPEPIVDEDGNLIDEGVDACELIYDQKEGAQRTGKKIRIRKTEKKVWGFPNAN